ncbi:MAG: PGPGW domain-containing protein [Gammaproteobacteria bacterium]
MLEWLRDHETWMWWLGASSLIAFLGSLIVIPIIVNRIPADYFMRPRHAHVERRHPLLRWLVLILKNCFGVLFLLAGIAMLVLPGQGILTILIGLTLLNFPGKHALEVRIVSQPAVLHAINWMRAKTHHPPLRLPARDAPPERESLKKM